MLPMRLHCCIGNVGAMVAHAAVVENYVKRWSELLVEFPEAYQKRVAVETKHILMKQKLNIMQQLLLYPFI